MPEPDVPSAVVLLAERRARARSAGDWHAADALRADIEQAGWRVVDDGTAWTLRPAHAPDVVEDGRRFHGSPDTVPSRLHEPPSARATIAVLADRAGATSAGPSPGAALGALARLRLPDVQVVVVAARGVPVEAACDELVTTAAPFTPAEALEAALRRASGRLVLVLAADRVASGDLLSPLEAALADPEVAVAGGDGLTSGDLRRYRAAPPGEVVALRSGAWAFRRADAGLLGLDPRLQHADSVAIWGSLALRDRGPAHGPRRAVAIELPLRDRDEADGDVHVPRRDGYRLADRFASRAWLAAGSTGRPHPSGT